jgi:hypothetical protein
VFVVVIAALGNGTKNERKICALPIVQWKKDSERGIERPIRPDTLKVSSLLLRRMLLQQQWREQQQQQKKIRAKFNLIFNATSQQ